MDSRTVTLLLLTVLAGCSSAPRQEGPAAGGPAGRSPEGAGERSSLFSMLDESLERKKARGRSATVDLKAGAETLPAGWSEKIDRFWKYWYFNHVEWPAKRAEWLALGPRARQILVENLIRYFVLAWDDGAEEQVRRAEREILSFQDLAARYLVDGLAAGFGDDVSRNIIGELFVHMDERAVLRIEHAWPEATPRGRRSLARALKKMRNAEGLPLMARIATGGDAWEVRIEAIQGLGELRTAAAVPALLTCLKDQDQSVRKFAAGAIAFCRVADRAVVEGLVGCMERFLEESRIDGARTCTASLRALTGRRTGTDPRAWRAWVAARERGDG